MEAFVSFNDRHPDLVSKSCLGGHSRCQRWLAEDDITSSRLHAVWMCVYACVCVHRLMSWSLNHCQSLTKAGSGCGWPGTARPVQRCRFALILPKIWQRENQRCLPAHKTSVWCSCFNRTKSVFLLQTVDLCYTPTPLGQRAVWSCQGQPINKTACTDFSSGEVS